MTDGETSEAVNRSAGATTATSGAAEIFTVKQASAASRGALIRTAAPISMATADSAATITASMVTADFMAEETAQLMEVAATEIMDTADAGNRQTQIGQFETAGGGGRRPSPFSAVRA
jgi:hypothetical protein